ncbi:MAG: AMP-binding protein, partial [Eubacterium sp.]|nr:AMP-binding protein [Eubacterium sp.]
MMLHELVDQYASDHPDKPALIDMDGEMSYGELVNKSNLAAGMLKSFGFETGDAAAIYVTYSKSILLGTVSVLRAGGVFIPMDDAYPIERLQYILKDSHAKAVLTVRALWERKKLDFPEDRVIFLDELTGEYAFEKTDEKLDDLSPAMLLYTSGTTGNPKGVLHNQAMMVHIADWINSVDGAAMDEKTRTGVMSSFSFVGSQMYLLGPLSKGGTVCIAPEVARKDLVSLYQFICEADITHIFLPAGLAVILAEDYDISGRNVFAAGEKLRNFRPYNQDIFLINSYGSTELSGVMAKKVFGDEEVISVGKPWENNAVMIVDEALKQTAPGEAGELLVSGRYMSRCYYGLPELSSEKWIELDGATWFRTGDRASFTPEGDCVILGRTDNMVKLRGFRIETGEVEAQIARAAARLDREDVGETVVLVKTVSGTEHLCCYYEADKDIDQNKMTEEISKYLAEYMVPDIWIHVDEFPRNTNGKILRRELPQPKSRHRTSGVLDSELISRIVITAADVLKPDGFIGPDDRFTDIGGTSLNAMQYAVQLRRQGIRISGSRIVQLNELRKIAEAAEVSYEHFWTAEEYSAIQKSFASRGEHIEKVLPLSTKQDEMLFMHILHPDRAEFRTTWFLQVDSQLSEKSLRGALDTVADENPLLRASVVFKDVSVIQQVITDRRIPLQMIEKQTFGSREMTSLRSQIRAESVDLQSDSLVKVYSIHTKERNFLCVKSYGIFVDEVMFRSCITRLMEILKTEYPEDVSINDWCEILTFGLENDEKNAPDEVAAPM